MRAVPEVGARLPARVRTEVWGVLDQALVSGVNFLTVILVARALAPADFGYFVIGFTILQSAGVLQAALITRPHNVLAAVRSGRAYADYTTTSFVAQIGLTAVLCTLGALASGVLYVSDSPHWTLAAAALPALVAWQLQEFGRRVLYTERRLPIAFANDFRAYGSQAAVLIGLALAGRLTAVTALLAMAATLAVGALAPCVAAPLEPPGRLDPRSLSAGWSFGKWLGVAEVGQWFSTHFYIYLGAAVLGSVASAALKAGQTLLGPVSVFLTFVTSYLPVVLAREVDSGGSVKNKTRRSLSAVLPVVVSYCVLVAIFAKPLLELVYGPAYGGYADVVRLYAGYYVVLSVSTVAVAALSARHMTREIFVGQGVAAAISLAFGWLLVLEAGPAGAVVGMLVSLGAALLVFVHALRAGASAGTGLPHAPASVDAVGGWRDG